MFNDVGNLRCDGLQPPADDPPHSYRFRLAALDVPALGLPERPSVGEVWDAARAHILSGAELVGTYAASS